MEGYSCLLSTQSICQCPVVSVLAFDPPTFVRRTNSKGSLYYNDIDYQAYNGNVVTHEFTNEVKYLNDEEIQPQICLC